MKRSYSLQMRIYLALRPIFQVLAPGVLKRRLKAGKEDPERFREKMGEATCTRPSGKLIWMHAVGLGELLALRPLITALQKHAPGLNVLLTSSARSSAKVIGSNLPANTYHQMLPLDAPKFFAQFLDHWRPDMSIWSEQDIWPGAVHDTANRGIPLAYVNSRISAASHEKRGRIGGLYRDTYRLFDLITAQDERTLAHFHALGISSARLVPSLKPAAEPLHADVEELARLERALAGRRVWVASSTHVEDEAAVIAAQAALYAKDPSRLLILTPRLPDRRSDIAQALDAAGLSFAQRSVGDPVQGDTAVLLADSFGELGLWYRLAETAFIGGSLSGVGGHNPWEAICLGLPVMSGPDTQNFETDYAVLQEAGLAYRVPKDGSSAQTIAHVVENELGSDMREKAAALVANAREETDRLARDLLNLTKAGQ